MPSSDCWGALGHASASPMESKLLSLRRPSVSWLWVYHLQWTSLSWATSSARQWSRCYASVHNGAKEEWSNNNEKQYLVQRQRNEEGPEKEHPALSWTGDFFFIAFMGRLKLMLALQNCPGSLLSVPVSTWRKCGVVKNNNGIWVWNKRVCEVLLHYFLNV